MWMVIGDRYEVSDAGNVRSLNYNKTGITKDLKLSKDKDGYMKVELWIYGKRQTYRVHRLVAELYLELVENKNEVNHKNGDKTDNRKENLEWVNKIENERHAINTLNKVSLRGNDGKFLRKK